MTNEELAVAAQHGDNNALDRLWSQTYKLTVMLLSRYFPLCRVCGCEPGDLIQHGFFALVDAVRSYRPESGLMFSTYLPRHLQSHARGVLGLDRQIKATPLSLDSDDTRQLADSAEVFEKVEESIQTAQLRKALEKRLSALPRRQAAVIYARYFRGASRTKLAAEFGVSAEMIRQLENKALSAMRKTRSSSGLEAFTTVG